MRFAVAILLTACIALAQFRATSTLVLAPATVVDAAGQFVDGLEAKDLVLYDNNVKQTIQVDEFVYPVSLVVAVEASPNAQAVVEKLGGSGILLSQLLAGNGGETAVLTFSDTVRVRQEFTTDADELEKTLRGLHTSYGTAAILDAVTESLRLLEQRRPERRRVILLIAEKRDRASKRKFDQVLREVQRHNVQIYWLTYSPSLTPLTDRPKVKDGQPVLYDSGAQNWLNIIPELANQGKPAVAQELTKATGGRTVGFLKQDALEEAIQSVGAEVHRQYMVSFQPAAGAADQFHSIRIEVKGRPELKVRARAGYWPAGS